MLRPHRRGDPEPPPDNGQHIALGAFTEYLRFLARIGSADKVRRLPLELTVFDESGRAAAIAYGAAPLLRYGHVPPSDRLRIAALLARFGRLRPGAETFGALLRRHGQTQVAIDRFWEVFIRPAVNLRVDEVRADVACFTVARGLRSGRAASDVGLVANPWNALNRLFSWSDKPCVPEVVPLMFRNSPSCAWAFSSELWLEVQ